MQSIKSANLGLRFLLEVAALVALGAWGRTLGQGIVGILTMLAVPAAAAALWGIFRTPGDASSAGGAPVAVPGALRLLLEAGMFGGAVLALLAVSRPVLAAVLGGLIALHYLVAYERVPWLLRQNPWQRRETP